MIALPQVWKPPSRKVRPLTPLAPSVWPWWPRPGPQAREESLRRIVMRGSIMLMVIGQ
jgi:hypothetical protein